MRPSSLVPIQALVSLPHEEGGALERQWLQDTLAWLKSAAPEKRTSLLRLLVQGIEEDETARAKFQTLWVKSFAARLFSEAGLPEGTSLVRELSSRLKKRFLPQVEQDLDLYSALQSAEPDDEDAQWVVNLSDEDTAPWRVLLADSANDLPVAIRLLAVRAAAIGLSRGVMKVMPHQYENESPFFDLTDAAGAVARDPQSPELRAALLEIVLQCRMSAGVSHAVMEEQGVSTDLVYLLDLVIAQLERIDLLARVLSGEFDGQQFAALLIRTFAGERGIRRVLRNSSHRLARQIVTHTGKSGEHYIAGSHSEWAKAGWGAVGAGVVTAFTALFKYLLAGMALAPLWTGVAHSLNYTCSFVLMQILGWRLASKMPSMTAAALCDAMQKEDGMQSEIRLVAAIMRTQTIVTLGNLAGAIPMSLLIDLLIQWKAGSPFLSTEAAQHGVHSMHLLHSMTIPFAALTGCFLWISSLAAGWTANWMAVNQFPAAVALSRRIRKMLGVEMADRFGHFLEHNLSGIAGYVCLGLLLGLLPFISVFVGLPVEVRHITLASASLTYAVSSLAWAHHMSWEEIGWATGGLLVTGLLNITVSFALGLRLAMRARNLDTRGRRKLVGTIGKELLRRPGQFLWRHQAKTI